MFAISDKKRSAAKVEGRADSVQRKADPAQVRASRTFARNIGNQGVGATFGPPRHSGSASSIQRQCHCGGTCAGCASKGNDDRKIQAKLTVGPVNDAYEQEADRVADSVMRMPADSIETGTRGIVSSIQRTGGGDNGGFDPGPDFQAREDGGQPLSEATRQHMEPRFGVDFSSVRVHTGARAAESASQIQARAYTHGHHITLGKGASEGDRQLMAHELTHVVQQGGASEAAQRMPLLPRIQRDPPPAADPCPAGIKKIDVFGVNLPGSSRSIYDDEAKANTVLAQCCAKINITGGESWDTNLMDTEAPNGVLNHSTTTATSEVQDMTAHRPGGNALHAYYVPSISIGSRGSSFYASRYGGAFPGTANAIQVANSAAVDSMVHELVHVLLDDGGHHADPDNLMADGGTRNVGVDNMDAAQCAGI